MPPTATAYVDRVTNLNMVEKHGNIRSLTRVWRIGFNPTERPTDYSVLSEALKLCPKPFTTLVNEGYSALVLVERSPSLAENDPAWVDVTLKYEHMLDGPNQILIGNRTNAAVFGISRHTLFGKGRCSIVEKTTNFFYPYGDATRPKVQIQTGHYFNPKDPVLVSMTQDPAFPNSIFQGGEVSIPFPQENFELIGVVAVTDPRALARRFVPKINDSEWLEKPAFTWLCSEVKWEVLDPGGDVPTYRFSFEFQYNLDGWNPTVVFNDQRTGRPPYNVRLGDQPDPNIPNQLPDRPINSYTANPYTIGTLQPAGYWTVPALEAVDFGLLFQKFFEGF